MRVDGMFGAQFGKSEVEFLSYFTSIGDIAVEGVFWGNSLVGLLSPISIWEFV